MKAFYGAEINFSENPKLLWNIVLTTVFNKNANYVEFIKESNSFDSDITYEISSFIQSLPSTDMIERKIFRQGDIKPYTRILLTDELKQLFLREDVNLTTWSMIDYIDPCFYKDNQLLLSTHASTSSIDIIESLCDENLYQELYNCELIKWQSIEDTQPEVINSRWK